jgi:6-phosphogluconolactonase
MRIAIAIFIMTNFFCTILGQNEKNDWFNLLIGTYTNTGKSEGIYVYRFNSNTGDFAYKTMVKGVENPSYLDISHDRKHVYAVNETGNGGLSSFSFNPVNGELVFINRISSEGDGPCYVSVDNQDKFVFAGNYGSGTILAVPLKDDGSLNAEIQLIKHEGKSINKSRQQGSHVHSTVLSPDNKYLMVADLGTDKVYIYRFNRSDRTNPLTPSEPSFISVKAGSGPRHLVFHPDSKFAYLIHEMEGMVSVFDYSNGKLTEKQTLSTLPAGFTGKIGAADIHVSPDGKFLYGSNRGELNDIAIYEIKKEGILVFAGRQSSLGRNPRNFAIDPTGNFLLVANQSSDDIIIFRRDKKTGMLTPTDIKIQVGAPVCLKFVSE